MKINLERSGVPVKQFGSSVKKKTKINKLKTQTNKSERAGIFFFYDT